MLADGVIFLFFIEDWYGIENDNNMRPHLMGTPLLRMIII
jgi:hypothetical protein